MRIMARKKGWTPDELETLARVRSALDVVLSHPEWSWDKLAKYLGCDRSNLGYWRNGKVMPNLHVGTRLLDLANTLR